MIISREVDINVNRYGLRVVIPVVQYDSGRQIIFNIVDAELPSGCTSNIFIKKPSGKSVYNACTVSGNSVMVTLTNQSLSECGLNDAQVQVINGEEVVTSFGFVLDVQKSNADDAVISRTESTFFQGLVSKAQAAAKTCTDVLDSIPSDYSKLSSDVAVLNSNWVNINTASELNSKLSALPSNKTLNVLAQGAVTAVLTNNMSNTSGKGYITKISDTSADYSIMTGSGDFIFIGRYNFSDGTISSLQKVPTRSEVDANTAAIATNKAAIDALNSNWVNINTASELNSKLSALPSNKTLNVLAQGAVTAVLTNNMASSSGKGYITKISDTSADYTIMTGAGDFIFIGRYNFSDGEVSSVQKVPTSAEIAANANAIATNANAIAAVKTDLLGGYKLVGYTASVTMPQAGEYIIPYPNGESFGTVYGILSATFLLGGYCLPYPPLSPSKSPSFDIKEAVSMRITSSGIILNTGGGWGAESRDIYFVLICKA